MKRKNKLSYLSFTIAYLGIPLEFILIFTNTEILFNFNVIHIIFLFAFIGIVLAIISLRQIKKTGDQGKEIAQLTIVSPIILYGAWIILAIIHFPFADPI